MRRRGTRAAPIGITLAVLAGTWTGTVPATAQTPGEVRAALDIPAGSFGGAEFAASDTAGIEVLSTAAAGFPTAGSQYLVLSTGRATDATLPNSEGNRSTELGALNNSAGHDLVQVDLRLLPPTGATCLSFDFRFLSEEFPEWVSSQFNDAFTAETVQTALTIENDQVVSPFNFAFDDNAAPISINTTFGASGDASGTTYDAATPLLRAVSPVEFSTDDWVHVWLSIQDLGDSIYDSAVFVDNFRWQIGGACTRGVAFQDSDGDALPDTWETSGVDFDSDGVVDLDLAAMGASPNHKDVFIELDYMVEAPVCMGTCTGGHTHKPKLDAVNRVVAAFRNAPVPNPDGTTGINLHVDAGADSVMNPATGALWGTRSRADALAHVTNLGTVAGSRYDWTAFDVIKNANFRPERRDVFHYGLYAHNYGGGTSSGISRGILGGDFIVSLGSFTDSVGTTTEQAGTLMHEFGHNLDLQHGGDDEDNYKPNYLSVMSYAFQLGGLINGGTTGHADYSRAALDALDENALDERIGLRPAASVTGLGTYYYCGGVRQRVDTAANATNWDCDATPGEASVPADVNRDSARTTLAGWNDWASIRYDGGGVGQLGEPADVPMLTELIEATKEDLEEAGALDTPHQVAIDGPGNVRVLPGTGSHALVYTVTNDGDVADTYSVGATAGPNADLSAVPAVLTLAPGQSARVEVAVSLPDAAATETVRLVATSVANALTTDEAETLVTALTIDAGNVAEVVEAAIGGLAALKAESALYARDADAATAQLQLALAALPDDVPAAILRLRKAVTSIEQLARTAAPADATTAERARGMVLALAEVARVLAVAEVDAAEAAGADPAAIALAEQYVATGDAHRSAGRMEAALNAYRDAALTAIAATP